MSTNGSIKMPEVATPDTPPTDYHRLFVGTDGILKRVDDQGDVTALTGDSELTFVVDAGNSEIITGAKKAYVRVPYNATILSWDIVLDQSGSIVFDIWQDTYANFPPTVADTITASAKPTVSAAQTASSSTLTGWTTTLTKGSYLEINVDSASTATKAVLTLALRKI